jgi:hypothetical protein
VPQFIFIDTQDLQYSSPSIIRVIISRRIRRAGDEYRIEERRNAYGILVEKSEGKKPLGRPRSRWGIILKWILES